MFKLFQNIFALSNAKYKFLLSLLLSFYILFGINEACLLFSSEYFLDILSNSNSSNAISVTLFKPGLFLFILLTISFCFKTLILYANAILASKIGNKFSKLAFTSLLNQKYIDIVAVDSSNYINLLTMQTEKMTACIELILNITSSAILFCAILIALFETSFVISLVVFFVIIASYSGIFIFTRNKLISYSYKNSNLNTMILRTLKDVFSLIPNIKCGNHNNYFVELFSRYNLKYRKSLANARILSIVPKNLIEYIALTALIIITLIRSDNSGESILPIIGAFALGLQRLAPAAQQIYNSTAEVQTYKASFEAIIETIGNKNRNDICLHSQDQIIRPNDKNLSLSVYNFSMSFGSEFNLSVPEFTINPGQIVAIIGKSGSGKSSFIKALIGFSNFDEGVVNYDNQQLLPDSQPYDWVDNFAYCPQQNTIIDQNVYSNVLLGSEFSDKSRMQAIEACKCSEAHGFIMDLPNKYDEFLGENGSKLSGGQTQRIGIARTLVDNKSIILLDEATSALDPDTELKVINNIIKRNTNSCVILVTHRYSNLSKFDKVYSILDHQSLVETTHHYSS